MCRLCYRSECDVYTDGLLDVGWLSSAEIEHDSRCHRMTNVTNLIVASFHFNVINHVDGIVIRHLCELIAVSRYICQSDLYDMHLTLDINTEIYPLDVGEHFKLLQTDSIEGEKKDFGQAVWDQVSVVE